MTENEREIFEVHGDGSGEGLPEVPQPQLWDSSYGYDQAVALAVVPDRALIFWELKDRVERDPGAEFRLIRLRLSGETAVRDGSWPIEEIGRFQDSGLTPGAEYIWVVSKVTDGEETHLIVSNPVRMPIRSLQPVNSDDLPSSIDLLHPKLRKALDGEE